MHFVEFYLYINIQTLHSLNTESSTVSDPTRHRLHWTQVPVLHLILLIHSWSCSCTIGTKLWPYQTPSNMFQLHIACTRPTSMLLYIQFRALLYIQFKALLAFHHEDHTLHSNAALHINKGLMYISCACAAPPRASWFEFEPKHRRTE